MRHVILQDEEGDALLVEVFSPLIALMIHRQMLIATSRAIDHRSARWMLGQIAGDITLTILTQIEHKLASRGLCRGGKSQQEHRSQTYRFLQF